MKKVSLSRKTINTLLVGTIFTEIVTIVQELADALIVGNVVGEVGVAAVNLFTPWLAVMTFIAGVISIGTMFLYCSAIGEFNQERADKLFGQGVILTITAGVVILLSMVFLFDAYMDYMNISDTIRVQAEAYLRYYRITNAIYPIVFLMLQLAFADGDSVIPSVASFVGVFGGAAAAIILGKKLGIAGVSLGTMLGVITIILILNFHMLRKNNNLHVRWHLSWKDVVDVFKLAITDSMTYICMGAVVFVINKLIVVNYGELYLPVATVAVSVLELTFVFDAVGQAMTPVAEMYLGEGCYSEENKLANYSAVVSVVFGLIIAVVFWFLAPMFPTFYGLTTSEVSSCSVQAVRIMALAMPAVSLGYMFTSQLICVRYIKLASGFMLMQRLILNLLFVFVLEWLVGFNGLWFSFLASILCTILISGICVYFKYGKERFPWLVPISEYPMYCESVLLEEDQLIEMRNCIEKFLGDNQVSKAVTSEIMMLVEECGLAIMNENIGKEIIAEYSVYIKEDQIGLIIRDNGKTFDLTDADTKIKDLNRYLVAGLMNRYTERQHLMAVSLNRNALTIPLN